MKKTSSFWRRGIGSLLSFALMLITLLSVVYLVLENRLPDIGSLNNIQLQVPLRIYTRDHLLIAEYGEKRRIPVTYDAIPQTLIAAVLATEDQRFFSHSGVDILGLLRAAIHLARTGTKAQGGSTITMQVARNFFLSRKKTYIRKINEILLAIKIDKELSKEKILELYLNKIYFGNRAYGVAAAAQVYYGKTLDQLTLAQQAMIAGLPKAPSRLNPLANPTAALRRRNHVLSRMFAEGYINQNSYQQAQAEPIIATYHHPKIGVTAPYIAELVRQTLVEHFGDEAYTRGFQVFTTIDSSLQADANQALHRALIQYDKRHGLRKPLANIGLPESNDTAAWLAKLEHYPIINQLQPAVVIALQDQSATAMLASGEHCEIEWPGLAWAREQRAEDKLGPKPQHANEILNLGDIIYLEQETPDHWQMVQVPVVEGSLIAMQPKDGALLALSGGFNFTKSNFNRATQAKRQPGSSFKPFIYSAALAKGYTLASTINDAPVVVNDPSLASLWRPQNDTRRFYGPTRLRIGLIHSRNLVSIRLLATIGIDYAIEFLQHFGFETQNLPHSLSLALGSASLTPLQLTTSYAVFANGGYLIEPYLIDNITNAEGDILFQAKPKIACANCTLEEKALIPLEQQAKQTLSPQVNYLMNLALSDVIQHGTGRAAKVLGRHDLAGKTGTTNDQVDAWFVGFNPNLLATVWVGFDKPKSLHEYSAKAALPMWIDFMQHALAGKEEISLTEPPGMASVRIDPNTGLLAYPEEHNSIFETFRQANVPQQKATNDANQSNSHSLGEDQIF